MRRSILRGLSGLALCLLPLVAAAADLAFVRDDTEVRRLDGAALRAECGEQIVSIDDPYYESRRSYRACPLRAVLEEGFGVTLETLGDRDVVFHALDGYTRPTTAKRLAESGGWLAFGDTSVPEGFAPMGPKGLDPGPFYVVWSGETQHDPHVYPWPYQLASIELADLSRRWTHITPAGMPKDAPAWKGYDVFRNDCIACHAINGEGGTVGPDLNVPQSIVEYRPTEQLKQYIRNPATFRYGAMPSHEYLTPADLDGLIAYFQAMRDRKHDPRAKPKHEPGSGG
jgi:mono/diheme cytochrome c family protein